MPNVDWLMDHVTTTSPSSVYNYVFICKQKLSMSHGLSQNLVQLNHIFHQKWPMISNVLINETQASNLGLLCAITETKTSNQNKCRHLQMKEVVKNM
jgi:hypothetical protein